MQAYQVKVLLEELAGEGDHAVHEVGLDECAAPLANYPQSAGSGRPTTWQGMVFVPSEDRGVWAWDISNPSQLGSPSKASGRSNGNCLSGDLLYAFDLYGGIKTYRLTKSPTAELLNLIEPELPLPGVLDGIAYDDLLYVSKQDSPYYGGTSLEIFRVALAEHHITATTTTQIGSFSFELFGRSGARYRIQKSPDLQTWQDWQDVSTYSDSIGFIDLSPPATNRGFYRALELSR